jgi:hypothetical protein
VQLEPRIGAEHGHAFLQRIERRGLHLDERVVGAFERQLLGDVLIEECEPAERMRLRHDAQRLAAGQVPEIFRQIFFGLAVERETLALPQLIIALLRQLARLAQFVEHFAVGRSRVEPFLGQAPELCEGAIVEAQFLFAIEDRDGRGELVERIGMRIDMLLQRASALETVGHVDGRADDASVIQRRMREGERAALSRHDGEAFRFQRLPFGARGRRQIAFGFFERELLLRRGLDVGAPAPDRKARLPHSSDSVLSRSQTGIGSASSMARKSGAKIARIRGDRLQPHGGKRARRRVRATRPRDLRGHARSSRMRRRVR